MLLISFRRRCANSTSQYIYKTLFEDGSGSDVTVCALGKEWRLHKVYLRQVSKFFKGAVTGFRGLSQITKSFVIRKGDHLYA